MSWFGYYPKYKIEYCQMFKTHFAYVKWGLFSDWYIMEREPRIGGVAFKFGPPAMKYATIEEAQKAIDAFDKRNREASKRSVEKNIEIPYAPKRDE